METVPQKGDVTSPVTHLVETQESHVLHAFHSAPVYEPLLFLEGERTSAKALLWPGDSRATPNLLL